MKMAWMALAAAGLLWTSNLQAQTLKLSEITCDDFVKSDKDIIGNLLMWLSGYYMGNNDDAIINFEKMEKNGEALGKYCGENPKAKLSKAAEKIMGK